MSATIDILIVDDSTSDLKLLSSILNNSGFNIRAANSSELAFRSIGAKLPDLIILDIKMPGIDGFEVCKRIKSNYKTSNIPIIFISAAQDADLIKTAFNVGGIDYINKPFNSIEVLARINTHLTLQKTFSEMEAHNIKLKNEIIERNRLEELLKVYQFELEFKVNERTLELKKKNEQLVADLNYIQKIEKAFTDSEHKYKTFFNSSPTGIGIANEKGIVFAMNKSMETFSGYKIEEMNNIGVDSMYFNPKERENVISIIKKQGNLRNYETKLVKKSGEVFDALLNIDLLEINNEKLMFTTLLDITDKKLTENALAESEIKLRAIFDTSIDAIGVSQAGKHIFVNPAYINLFGYLSSAEILEKTVLDIIAHSEREYILNNINKRVNAEPAPTNYETIGLKKDGTEFPLEVNVSSYTHAGIVYTVVILRDIRERKAAQIALMESEKKFKLMVNVSPEAIIVHSGGKILYANPSSVKLIEADSADQLLNTIAINFVHPDYRAAAIKRIKKMYETGEPSEFNQEKFITFKNKVIDVEVIGIPISYLGQPAIQTIIRDISERKKYESVLQSKIEELERFNNVTIDRELKMIELKKEVNNLLLQLNKNIKYEIH